MAADDRDPVADGYNALYDAIDASPAFQRIWRTHAMGTGYPEGFEHIGTLRASELRRIATLLRVGAGDRLLDLACGAGGPGLWIARETGAALTGVDLSSAGIQRARRRASDLGVEAEFRIGSFAQTGGAPASADAVMTIDALQYAPDKRAALREIARTLVAGGRFVFTTFELIADRVRELPVWGEDPVQDYVPLLRETGFSVESYDESDGGLGRLLAAYRALRDDRETLTAEMGEAAAGSLLLEVGMTLELQPYARHVLGVAVAGPA